MSHADPPRDLLRSSVAAAVAAMVALGLLVALRDAGRRAAQPGAGLDEHVAGVVVLLGTLAAAVLALGCLLLWLASLADAAGRSSRALDAAARRLTPAALRRAVTVTVGAGLGLAATTGVATAAELDLGWEPTTSDSVPAGNEQQTESPTVHVARSTTPTTAPQTTEQADETTVTVAAGDSLWSLSAAHLGPDADDAAIAAAWPRWYEANRAVIGPEPDLILPGQTLQVPDAATDPKERS